MSKCVNCGESFEDGFNPFYCSEVCANLKNAVITSSGGEDPYLHIRQAHKANSCLIVVNLKPVKPVVPVVPEVPVTAKSIASGKW